MRKGIGPHGLGAPKAVGKQTATEIGKKVAALGSMPAGLSQAGMAVARAGASAYVQESNRRAEEAFKKGALAGSVAAGQASKKQAQNKGEKQFRDTTGMGPSSYGQAKPPKTQVGSKKMMLPYMMPNNK